MLACFESDGLNADLSLALPGTSHLGAEGAGGGAEEARRRLAQPVFGKDDRARMVRRWNEAVDGLFGKIVQTLSERGW